MQSFRYLSATWLAGWFLVPALALADWPSWRGPEQNGISREKNLVDNWSYSDRENVLWVSEIGGRATPAILNGRVYLNARTHHDVTHPEDKIHARELVVCWDLETGEVLWMDHMNVFQTDVPASRVGWASICADPETEYVYVHTVSGIFRCYTADGEVVWERSLHEEFGQITGYGGRTQSPMIDEDLVIISFNASNWGETRGPQPRHYYYAFDKRTGQLEWVSVPGGAPQDANYSVPVVTVINGERLLIGGNGDGNIYAMRARTGEMVWQFRMSTRGLNATCVVDGNYVYISHGEDNIDNTEFGRVQCIDATGTGDVTDTHGVWRVDGVKAGYTGLLVKDGILYVVTDTGRLFAFDSQSGEKLWEHPLGTIGKGSPVWADGKIYVTENNGNVHILRPYREGCESLSRVLLMGTTAPGPDEIFASPAISNGRIVIVARDRTICIGRPDAEVESDPIPPLAEEDETDGQVAYVQLRPYEVSLRAGESANYQLYLFDRGGRLIETRTPELRAGDGMESLQIDGDTITAPSSQRDLAGSVVAQVEGHEVSARVRVFIDGARWAWDFNDLQEGQVPPTWVRAFGRLRTSELNGDVVMRLTGLGQAPGRPSHYTWLGPPDMSGYTIQADVFFEEQQRRMGSAGIIAQRYTLLLKANQGVASIQTWQAHLRMAREVDFDAEPETWYTMKMTVDVDDDGATIYGKVWPRDVDEPDDWTIVAHDPHANAHGAPGLNMYQLAPMLYDNVIVTLPDVQTSAD